MVAAKKCMAKMLWPKYLEDTKAHWNYLLMGLSPVAGTVSSSLHVAPGIHTGVNHSLQGGSLTQWL